MLTEDEALVALGVVHREVDARCGQNLAAALVDVGELAALHLLGERLAEANHEDGPSASFEARFRVARARLTPALDETYLVLDLVGQDDGSEHADASLNVSARSVPVDLDADLAVVLYEWFLREVDERTGANLLDALVTMGEFWALNAIANLLEAATPYAFDRPFRDQVLEGRLKLSLRYATPQGLRMAGVESSSMGASD
jgi:hypothetical protein